MYLSTRSVVELFEAYLCFSVYFNSCPQLVPMALEQPDIIVKGYVYTVEPPHNKVHKISLAILCYTKVHSIDVLIEDVW